MNRAYLLATLGVAFFSTQMLHAGDDMKSIQTVDQKSMTTGPYDYHVHSDLRHDNGIGLGLGVYGGVVALQSGSSKINFAGGNFDGDTQSRVGGTAGIRVTNVWPSFSSITGGEPTGELGLVLPAMALDIFWTGYNYKAKDSSNNSITTDLNEATFAYVPELKFNLGCVRPYVGVGIGGTYLASTDVKLNGNATHGSDDDFDFSAEGLAGVEFFIDPRWAISLEYKFLYILDPRFDGQIAGTNFTHKIDGLGQHYLTAGLNYYF